MDPNTQLKTESGSVTKYMISYYIIAWIGRRGIIDKRTYICTGLTMIDA